ncbi:MAG: hypothetical protein HC826_02725 [Rhodospirillales bacterium]|nr:hypothetical protein [Rhodospirillales bacterium]
MKKLFQPGSIALIGADRQPRSIGSVLARNLFSGQFEGPVLPVHARLPAVRGVLAFSSIAELPIAPDLAVIASPADEVPGLITDLGARGTHVAVVLTAVADRAFASRLAEAAKEAGVRVVGPACLGIIVPAIGLNATYAHTQAKPGDVALIAQSGSLVSAVLDSAAGREAGFSVVASLGDMIDIDFAELLDFLALDPRTRAILLAIDCVVDATKRSCRQHGSRQE